MRDVLSDGPVLVLEDRHHLPGSLTLLEQVYLVGRFMPLLSLLRMTDSRLSGGRVNLVLPATGVGSGTLIGVTMIEVTREQAAAGIGDAKRTVDENLEFHLRTGLPDLPDLIQ